MCTNSASMWIRFKLSTAKVLGLMVFVVRGCPGHCKLFSSIPSLHQMLYTPSPCPGGTTANVPRHCLTSPGEQKKILPVQNSCTDCKTFLTMNDSWPLNSQSKLPTLYSPSPLPHPDTSPVPSAFFPTPHRDPKEDGFLSFQPSCLPLTPSPSSPLPSPNSRSKRLSE